tara:strand:+ start:12206 stop:13207 length:1002 start_codon:yes stop_codon:yes gene_type:complete
MFAIVLVGGFGTRLRPLTEHVPKQMLPICGIPMIELVVGHLADHGVEKVGLAMGYRPDAFLEAYPNGYIAETPYEVAVESEPLGTAGAIRFAVEQFQPKETFLVLNGDVLTDLDVRALVEFHHEVQAEVTIALQPVDDPSSFGVVTTDTRGRVEAFIEKPEKGSVPSHNINAGTYVLEPSAVEQIPQGRPVSVERETFPELAASGTLYALPSATYWLDTGTPQQFIQANLDMLNGKRKQVPHLPEAVIDPTSLITQSVIGSGSEVGVGAIIDKSVVLDRCQIGANSEVLGSILSEDVRVGQGARLDGCVIGQGQHIEPGEILINQTRPELNPT